MRPILEPRSCKASETSFSLSSASAAETASLRVSSSMIGFAWRRSSSSSWEAGAPGTGRKGRCGARGRGRDPPRVSFAQIFRDSLGRVPPSKLRRSLFSGRGATHPLEPVVEATDRGVQSLENLVGCYPRPLLAGKSVRPRSERRRIVHTPLMRGQRLAPSGSPPSLLALLCRAPPA